MAASVRKRQYQVSLIERRFSVLVWIGGAGGDALGFTFLSPILVSQ